MVLNVAFQMDPIDRIDVHGDSTFALLLEAQRRGHDIFYYTPPDLALRDGGLIAHGHTLKVKDRPGDHYELSDFRTVSLEEFDVVQLRQDPPFDMSYITTTHLLERIHPDTLVVNDPEHVRNAPEKVFVLNFLDLMPPTHDAEAITPRTPSLPTSTGPPPPLAPPPVGERDRLRSTRLSASPERLPTAMHRTFSLLTIALVARAIALSA